MAFPSKRPADVVVALGLGKPRGGSPPLWEDKKPFGADGEAPPAAADEAPGDECPKCCKQAAGCKFYEPVEGEPSGAPADSAGDELGIRD